MERRIILAADELTLEQCLALGPTIGDKLYAIKIHNLYDLYGPGVVIQLREAGYTRVWVDAKLHDIPNTVKLRAQAIAQSGAQIVTVHASGGIAMMQAAVASGLKVFAVTVLTSLSEEEAHLTFGNPSKATVLRQSRDARMASVAGIVCSPQEVSIIAKRPELKGLEFITPGIRLLGQGADDQKRVDTPAAAIQNGATRLVIGRAISNAADPAKAVDDMEDQIPEIPSE